MPAFAIEKDETWSGSPKSTGFRHMDAYRKRSFTREQSSMQQALISKQPISLQETQIVVISSGLKRFLSLEDALDLHLCMSFNLINR